MRARRGEENAKLRLSNRPVVSASRVVASSKRIAKLSISAKGPNETRGADCLARRLLALVAPTGAR